MSTAIALTLSQGIVFTLALLAFAIKAAVIGNSTGNIPVNIILWAMFTAYLAITGWVVFVSLVKSEIIMKS